MEVMGFLVDYPVGSQVAAPKKKGIRLSVLTTLIIFLEMKLHRDKVEVRKIAQEHGVHDGKVVELAKLYGCEGSQIRKIGNGGVRKLLLGRWSAFDEGLYHRLLTDLQHFERESLFASKGFLAPFFAPFVAPFSSFCIFG
jgi:hypothetical protein